MNQHIQQGVHDFFSEKLEAAAVVRFALYTFTALADGGTMDSKGSHILGPHRYAKGGQYMGFSGQPEMVMRVASVSDSGSLRYMIGTGPGYEAGRGWQHASAHAVACVAIKQAVTALLQAREKGRERKLMQHVAGNA